MGRPTGDISLYIPEADYDIGVGATPRLRGERARWTKVCRAVFGGGMMGIMDPLRSLDLTTQIIHCK